METVQTLQARIEKLPRVKLASLPTPLEEMVRLTKQLNGPRLWIKRDDCTGLAFGGNKERKAEFSLADALSKKADVVITTGGIQSNHVRATTAAANRLGLKVVLVVYGKKPKEYEGNLLLDYLLGAEIRFVSAGREFSAVSREIAEELRRKGHVPYVIPVGASYTVGAVAYVDAMLELLNQANERGFKIDHVVHAAGSGGTQAGLILANKALNSRVSVLGMCDEPDGDWLVKKTVEIANDAAKLLNLKVRVESKDVTLITDYAGEKYGVLTTGALEAIKLVGQTEGILLDPVYTGKAMAGLIDMTRRKRFGKKDNVVFIHTGGLPALFAYEKELRST